MKVKCPYLDMCADKDKLRGSCKLNEERSYYEPCEPVDVPYIPYWPYYPTTAENWPCYPYYPITTIY